MRSLPDDAITITFDSKLDARHFFFNQMENGMQAVLVYENEKVFLLTGPSVWTKRRSVGGRVLEHETVIAVLNADEAPLVDSFDSDK
jgi:hypothetical protein